MYLRCLEPVRVSSSNNNSDKESGGDDASAAALGIEVVSHAGAASLSDSSCDVQFGKAGGIVQGRLAREPVDRARYVMIDGSSGTTFACSRCSKQYIHRKSLNKHWNDKHADDTVDRHEYLQSRSCTVSEPQQSLFNMALVYRPSDSQHVAFSCSSSAVHSQAVRSSYSAMQVADSWLKTHSKVSRNQTQCNIGHSALWHSLVAIHKNEEPDFNSFCYAPMPAHTGSYNSGKANFLNKIFCNDDCQVLDLSVGSSAVHKLPNMPVPDKPVDLSMKSLCLEDVSEKTALPLHGIVSKSAVSCYKEISAADTEILSKPKMSGNKASNFGGSKKDRKFGQSDAIAVLRRLHSGVLTNATKQSDPTDCSSCNAVTDISVEPKSNHAKVQPTGKYLQLPNSVHLIKNSLKMPAQVSYDLARPEDTHEYFGGMCRGGYIQCKKCDFSATSMLLFSRHVARHVRKPNVMSAICDNVQNECAGSICELENRFFMWLGLQRTPVADVESVKKSSGGCRCAAVDSLGKDENSEDRTDKAVVGNFAMQAVRANGFGSHCDDESRLQSKNSDSDSVQQKPEGGCRRGLGLTTTESRDAVGRSWRRRRLRTCERCGYVTDNVTTLKRHEVKHGAVGMYRCKLCDYTVNQQHILEYHTRNVHGLGKQTGQAQLALFRITKKLTPPANSVFDERFGRTATSLIGDGRLATLSKNLSDSVNTGGSAVGGSDVFACSSEVAKVCDIHCAVSTCSMQKVMVKNVFASVTLARRHLLDAFGLQVGHGVCVRCGFRSLNTVKMKWHMLLHPHDRHTCSQCSHTSLTARLLLKHMRQQHTDCKAGNLALKCPECPFLAASANRLQRHNQFHGANLRHLCGKCSYSADRANLIAQHRRLHVSSLTAVQKQRWLHCRKCPFRTVNKGSLLSHERGHSAANCQYMCSLCSFGTDVANVAFHHQHLH